MKEITIRRTTFTLLFLALSFESYASELNQQAQITGQQVDATIARVASHDARESASSNDREANSNSALEQVLVTARRREERAQSVPIAISVVSQQKLSDNNVQTLGDLQYLIPSMDASTILTRDAINASIRGQGGSPTSGLPGVVAYLNEVPLPNDGQGNLAGGPGLLFDMENVEALKGPQGTLFGRNSIGGALLLQSARPKNEFGGSMQVGVGNYNAREIDGHVNLPILDDMLLARIAINGQVRDGFTHILSDPGHPDGVDADNRDYWSTRATVTFKPNDRIQSDSIFTYSRYTSHGSPLILNTCDSDPNTLANSLYPTFLAQCERQLAFGARTVVPLDTISLSAGHNLSVSNISRVDLTDKIVLRNILGYMENNWTVGLDDDGSVEPIINIPDPAQSETARQVSEELQLLGNNFGGRVNWTVGGLFLHYYEPESELFGIIFSAPISSGVSRSDRSTAIYGQGTCDLSELIAGLKFTAGARYTKDYRSMQPLGSDHNQVRNNAVTWTTGLDYQATSDTLIYLTARRGYQSGGFNTDAVGRPLPGFGPQFVTDTELGIKSDWSLGKVKIRTNADIFYQKFTDIQVSVSYFDANNIPVAATANAAAARLWGTELETTAELTRDLTIGATFDNLNFKYTSFGADVQQTTIENLIGSRNGRRIPYKYGFNARYEIANSAETGSLSIQANWNWQASYEGLYGAPFEPGASTRAFGLLNLSASWERLGGGPIDVSVFASNVLNKTYEIAASGGDYSIGFNLARFGEPRMYGLRLRYKFGGERQ